MRTKHFQLNRFWVRSYFRAYPRSNQIIQVFRSEKFTLWCFWIAVQPSFSVGGCCNAVCAVDFCIAADVPSTLNFCFRSSIDFVFAVPKKTQENIEKFRKRKARSAIALRKAHTRRYARTKTEEQLR